MRTSRMMKVRKHLAVTTSAWNNNSKLGRIVALVKGASANPKGAIAEEARHENPYASYPWSREHLCCAAR